MKAKNFSNSLVLITLSVFLFTGCMLLKRPKKEIAPTETQQIDAAKFYDAGLKAFEAGKYIETLTHFRKIPKKSPYYPQALKVARKIPLKRATLAYNQQKFEAAIQELDKVKKGHEDFDAAQAMILKSRYYLQVQKYEVASGEEKLTLLGDAIKQALALKRSDMVLQSVDAIGNEFENIKTVEQAKTLLNYLQNAATLKDNAVLKAALREILNAFHSLNKQFPELRAELFQLIQQLKVGLL